MSGATIIEHGKLSDVPNLVEIEGMGGGENVHWNDGIWRFDEADMLLFTLLTDPVYCAEFLFSDPINSDYGGCYHVRDYQYPLFRIADEGNNAGAACARTVGKTESVIARAVSHVFRRHGENLLVTAPELIHLLPLTDAIEGRIMDITLTRSFLDTRNQKTGFTHRPFGAEFRDNTKIIGRIPRLTGTGVKGQHQPDLIIDEAQDYPERGWIEVHETVLRDHVDLEGNVDYSFTFYGVHSGARDTGFYTRTTKGGFVLLQVTALQRPGWGSAEKDQAKGAYGGTESPDYRRNILGEPGAPATAFFVISRLMATVDQDRESDYNTLGYVHQTLRVEEVDEMNIDVGDLIDLPSNVSSIFGGMDLGLTNSPTEIVLFDHANVNKVPRLSLVRRYTLQRFRTKQIRKVTYAIAEQYGAKLASIGIDITGLGFPIFQEMEDDEAAPPRLLEVSRGYFFNAKLPVGVEKDMVYEDAGGQMRDQYGSAVKVETDPLSGVTRYITLMPMIAASTRYLREWVDSGFLRLPFDPEVVADMQGETQQRIRTISQLSGQNKPNALHILDAMRGMAMGYKAGDVEAALAIDEQQSVLDIAVDMTTGAF